MCKHSGSWAASCFLIRKFLIIYINFIGYKKLDDGWPESEKDVFQAALSMVVVKNSRWMVGEFYMSYGRVSCEK